jgi:hypothetical protein
VAECQILGLFFRSTLAAKSMDSTCSILFFCLGRANKMLESMKKSLFFLAVWFLYRIFAAQTTKNGFA